MCRSTTIRDNNDIQKALASTPCQKFSKATLVIITLALLVFGTLAVVGKHYPPSGLSFFDKILTDFAPYMVGGAGLVLLISTFTSFCKKIKVHENPQDPSNQYSPSYFLDLIEDESEDKALNFVEEENLRLKNQNKELLSQISLLNTKLIEKINPKSPNKNSKN